MLCLLMRMRLAGVYLSLTATGAIGHKLSVLNCIMGYRFRVFGVRV